MNTVQRKKNAEQLTNPKIVFESFIESNGDFIYESS